MPPQAVIFDLDETLLDTSALLRARDRRDFADVYARLHLARIFEVDGKESPVATLPDAVSRRGLGVGLYTHSPERYARELLGRFRMRVDAMVTGSDHLPPKPDPAGLLAVASLLGVDPTDCLYVGDSVGDFGAAAAARMRSVGVSWTQRTRSSWRHGWPDIAIDRPGYLLRVIAGAENFSPLAEARARGLDPMPHWGALLHLGHATYGLGRYFPTGDRRYATHSLSHLILQAKDDPAASAQLAESFTTLTQLTTMNRPPQLVVSVPPAPGAKRDRFGEARAILADAYQARDGTGLLYQAYDVEDYKRKPRRERVRHTTKRFKVNGTLAGERVLLIDDVLTSGAQTSACRKALIASGARAVTVLVAAGTQDRLPVLCPACGESLGGTIRVRRRRVDGKEFQGCSRYPECEWSRDIPAHRSPRLGPTSK
jgi:HAD superfamily hydrolase (TIGR01549 family)